MNAIVTIANGQVIIMSSLEISGLVDSRHDKVKQSIERLAERRVITLPPTGEVTNDGPGPKTIKVYRFTGEQGKRDSIIVVAQLCPEFTARLVDRWQELEAQASKPTIPQTLPEALRLAADLAEQKALAEQQRDEAVATKALIGNKREATAMATASQATRKAARLEIALDKSMQYASVKRMEAIYRNQKFNWRVLKAVSAEIGIQPHEAFDENYGSVKTYHADVWMKAYGLSVVPPINGTKRSAPAIAVAEAQMQTPH